MLILPTETDAQPLGTGEEEKTGGDFRDLRNTVHSQEGNYHLVPALCALWEHKPNITSSDFLQEARSLDF